MSLSSDMEIMNRPDSPEVLFENTFSDTEDELDVDVDSTDDILLSDTILQCENLSKSTPLGSDMIPSSNISESPENDSQVVEHMRALPVSASTKPDSTKVSGPSSDILSDQTVSVTDQPTDALHPGNEFIDYSDVKIESEQSLLTSEADLNLFSSDWTLTEEDLRCFPYRKSINESSSMESASLKQFESHEKFNARSSRKNYEYFAKKMVNMSPYARIARMAKSEGYDLAAYLETLEYSGASNIFPCMQCYEKYGGKQAASTMFDDYVGGTSIVNGRCQKCGGQVHTMATYGVMLRKLREVMSEKDLIPHDVYPDGNCLFAAVIDQLHVHNDFSFSVHSLRLQSVEYMRNNPTVEDGTSLEMFLSDETFEEYLTRMSQDGEWGDHIVLSAIANVINIPIYIYGGMSGQNETVVLPKHSGVDHNGDNLMKLYLGNIGESHYFSLRPKNWKEEQYNELVKKNKSKMEARCPMQYFNFILRQIFRMDALIKFKDLSVDMIATYGLDELFKETDFDMQLLGPSVCQLVPGKAESDSWAVDISIFFPTAKVEDVSKVDKGIFMFWTPNDTEIVIGNASADSFDLIAEPQKTIGLLKLSPVIPELWEGQTLKSPNEEVYLKNIDLTELDDNYDDVSYKVDAKSSSVLAFNCSWPRQAEEWMTRFRSSDFPNEKIVETIIAAGCHVVTLRNGLQMADYLEQLHDLENPDIVWCYSFASAEKEICRFISSEQRQCYFLFRSTASSVPSNHLLPMVIFKSIFFYACENIADSTWKSKPGECYFILLKKLAEGLKNGFIPHYFLPEKNLLEYVAKNSIRENLKMLTFTRHQPLTSLYFLLDSMNLMSSEACSFIEEMIQSACHAEVREDQQSEQLIRACTSLLGSLITDQKYHNAMLVLNSLMDETALSEDKSVEMLNKQLWHIDMRRKWCFALYVDIRQKSSLTKHLCYDIPTINITELFGDDCTEELPNTIVPECYSIQNGDLYFLKWVTEVLEQCVGSKVQAKCMKFYLKKYSELAGDALVLPAIGVMEANPKMCTKYFETDESNLEYYLLQTLGNLYVTLFNIYYQGGRQEEFRELMPAYEMVAKATDRPLAKQNLYMMWNSLGETKKARAVSNEMKNSQMGLIMFFQ